MVRMHFSESEILQNVTTRRLLTPLDAAAEKQLTSDGASAKLIAAIKAGNYAVPAETASALARAAWERDAVIAREKAADEKVMADRLRLAAISGDMLRAFDGKLVRRKGGSLEPCALSELGQVQYVVLYYSASWCAPCRQFTPKLVDFYNKTKAKHPEVEIIFVSHDHNASAMEAYMNEEQMPWPAVRFDQIDKGINKYADEGIPWLVIFDRAGAPVQPPKEDPNHPRPHRGLMAEETLEFLVQQENQGGR